jgi:pimeloyl-[acyl-carrier protein] methyl ester esterase
MKSRTLGSGPPILFLPGWLTTSAWWQRQAGHFALSHRTLLVDYPACDAGPLPAGPPSIDGYARHLHALLQSLGEPAVAVGWSMGAGILLRKVELFGTSLLRGLVLVDQTPRSLPAADWEHGVIGLTNEMRQATPDLVRRSLSSVAARVTVASLASPPATEDLDWMCDEARRWSPSAAADLIVDHWTQDYRSAAAMIDVPTFLVAGGRSAFTPVAAMRYLHQTIRASTLDVFKDSGHAPFWEESERFNARLAEFLEAL